MPTTANLELDYPTPLDPATADIWGDILNDIFIAFDSEHALKTIPQDFNDKLLQRPLFRDEATDVTALGSVSGAINIDISLANIKTLTLTGNAALSFSNAAPNGKFGYFYLWITPAGHTVTFPASCKNSAGELFTLTGDTGTIEVFGKTFDSGALWRVKQGDTWL